MTTKPVVRDLRVVLHDVLAPGDSTLVPLENPVQVKQEDILVEDVLSYKDDIGDEDYGPPAKRRRGRPKGSGKKSTVKRKRGRPRKEKDVPKEVETEVLKKVLKEVGKDAGKEVAIPGQRRLAMTEFKCFICTIETESFDDVKSLADHVMSMHTETTDEGYQVLPCLFCSRVFKFSRDNFRWDHMADTLAIYFPHLIDVHKKDFTKPDYVTSFLCPHEDCDHVQYCIYQMRVHLKRKHGVTITSQEMASEMFSDVVCEAADAEEEEEEAKPGKEIVIPGQRRPKFTRYECFLCPGETLHFDSDKQFTFHIKNNHLVQTSPDRFVLRCPLCAKNYSFTRRHVNWVTICQTLASFLTHMTRKHSEAFKAPSYIIPIACPLPSCKHSEFTVFLMRRHLHQKHKILITDWQTAKSMFPWITEDGELNLADISNSEFVDLEEEEESPELVSATKALMHRMPMSKFDCFLCPDEPRSCATEIEFLDHIAKAHLIVAEDERRYLKCPDCDQGLFVDVNVLDLLPVYASHRLDVHPENFTLPSTVSMIGCPEGDCQRTFFCLADMKRHLQDTHSVLLDDSNAVQALFPDAFKEITLPNKKPRLDVVNTKPNAKNLDAAMDLASLTDLPFQAFLTRNRPIHLRGQRRLVTTSHNCFLCEMVANTVVHASSEDLYRHIREIHIQQKKDNFSLTCVLCVKAYSMKRQHTNPAALADTLCRLFTHIMEYHTEVEKPEYVLSITCPITDCIHVSYSVMAIVDHFKSVHGVVIASTEVLERIFPALEGYLLDVVSVETERGVPGRRRLLFTSLQCFMCCDDVVFDTDQDLANHFKDSHLTQVMLQFSLDCAFCTKKYILKANSVRWNVICDTLARYLSHLVVSHQDEFTVPDFVGVFECLQCERTDLFNLHSFSKHLVTDHNTVMTDYEILQNIFPHLTQLFQADLVAMDTLGKGCRFLGHRRLVMTKYLCIVCHANSEDTETFRGEAELANHVKESHFVKKASSSSHALQCVFCSEEYICQATSMNCCNLCEMLVRYTQHLHNEHEFDVPDWINSFPCTQCVAVMFSLFSARRHLKDAHGISLSDDKALVIYPFLSSLDATTSSSVLAKRTFLSSKEVDLWKKPLSLPLFAYAPFSTNVDADSLPDISNLKEFELTLTEIIACPLCEIIRFENADQLREHWINSHFTRAKEAASLSCKFCLLKICCPEDVLSPEFAAKAMASYMHHLLTNHSTQFCIPSYVVHSVCPFYSCSQVFFNLFSMKLHLRTHSVITHDLKSFVIPLEPGVENKLSQYTCFLCGKNEDYSTALSFVNHCIDKHLEKNDTGYSVDCHQCPQSSVLLLEDEVLTASKVMTLAISHAEHLVNEHSVRIEGLVPLHNSTQKMKLMFEHHAVSQPVTNTAEKKSISVKLHMRELRCLLCDVDKEFSNLKEMLVHYSETHLQGAQLKCPHCSHYWLVASEDQVLNVVPLIASHVHRRHPNQNQRLQYIEQHECVLSVCPHISFTTVTEKKHLQSHHLQLSSDILTPNTWTLPLAPTQAIFTRYCCFRCSDQNDHGSLMAYINHWMTSHCSVEGDLFSFKCQHCDDVYQLTTKHARWTKKLFSLIGEHLSHLITAHDFKQPDYVFQAPGRKDLSKAIPKPKSRIESLITYQDMHDSQASMLQIECFQCNTPAERFPTTNELYEHWKQEHFTSIKNKRSAVRCKFCHACFQPRRWPVPEMGSFMECLTIYALHLSTEHNHAPACLRSAPCPVYGCNFMTFSLHRLRQHLRLHGVGYALEPEIRSGDIELPSTASHAVFGVVFCILCSQSPSFEAPIFLVNHYLEEHYAMLGEESVLTCSQCTYELVVSGVVSVPTVWDHICAMLVHLVSEHACKVPEYIQRHLCTLEGCGHVALTRFDSEKHSLLHTGSLAGHVKFDEWYELQYIKLQCFSCLDAEVYPDAEALAVHWLKQHMVTTTDSAYVIECSACELEFTKKSSGECSIARGILRLVAEYLQHLHDSHEFTVPTFISLFVCDHEKCTYSSYIPEKLVHHEVEMHMENFQEKPGCQVVLKDNKVLSRKDHPLYHRKPFEVTFTRLQCFLCDDDHDHQSLTALNEHMQSVHGTPSPRGFITECLYCSRKFASDNRRRTATTVFGHMLCHMVDVHGYTAPSYVERLTCTQPNCQYFTFTVDNLSTHLKAFHGIIDVGLSRGKKKTFFARRQTNKSLTCKMIVRLREYRCFACDNDPLVGSTVQEYARHWLTDHITATGATLQLNCLQCPHEYTIPAEKRNEASLLMIRVSFFFMHMINNHGMPAPAYVMPYSCEIPGCTFVTYTLHLLENHCKGKHNLSAEEMILNTEEISTTMIIVDDTICNIHDFLPPQSELVNMPSGSHTLVSQQEGGPPLQTVVDIQHQVASSYRCLTCGDEFETVDARKRHIRDAHDQPKNHLCYVCSSAFTSKRLLDGHLLNEHSIANKGCQAYLCDHCDFKTLAKGKLERHLKLKH